MQQRPQLGVLPLQAPRLGEELADIHQCRTANTGNRRSAQGSAHLWRTPTGSARTH